MMASPSLTSVQWDTTTLFEKCTFKLPFLPEPPFHQPRKHEHASCPPTFNVQNCPVNVSLPARYLIICSAAAH